MWCYNQIGECERPDDLTVWLHLDTWIWLILLVTQASMVVFLLIHGRKEKSFRAAFYIFFIAVTVVDGILVIWRAEGGGGFALTVFGTQYDHTVLARVTTGLIVPVCSHAQPLIHTIIAVNRFTAFLFPMKHAEMWRPRKALVLVAFIAAISMLLGGGFPVYLLIREARELAECLANAPQNAADTMCFIHGREERCTEEYERTKCWRTYYDNALNTMQDEIITLTSAICCVVGLALNMGSVTLMVVLRLRGKLQQQGPELRLFIHSLFMFALQTLLFFQDAVRITNRFGGLTNCSTMKELKRRPLLDSTEWLAGFKPILCSGDSRYNAGCKMRAFYLPQCGPRVPMCPWWYRFMVAKDDSDWIRVTEQLLFALSGAVFLFVISGHARSAYFKFYFRWLLKKPRRITVLQVAAPAQRQARLTV